MTTDQGNVLSEGEIRRLFAILSSRLKPVYSLTEARNAIAAAGLVVNAPIQYWDPFLTGVTAAFEQLEPDAQITAIEVLADQLSTDEPVQRLLAKHGYRYTKGSFVSVELLDPRDAPFLPSSSVSQLAMAMKRLIEEDNSGSITSACGAVDGLMNELNKKHGLDMTATAFAAKVNTVVGGLKIYDKIKNYLIDNGLNDKEADTYCSEMKKAVNHTVNMLAVMRRSMGDVHGSKQVDSQLAFEAVKWSSAICGLFHIDLDDLE